MNVEHIPKQSQVAQYFTLSPEDASGYQFSDSQALTPEIHLPT
jgi:hypothetical protein